MSVTLAKITDGTPQTARVEIHNAGGGPVMIAGLPVRKFSGAIIRVGGPRMLGVPVRCVVIERKGAGGRASYVTSDGTEHPGPVGEFEAVRRYILRKTVLAGTFAGVTQMR